MRNLKYLWLCLLLLSTLFSSSLILADSDEIHELVILHTNDTHGHPLKFYDNPADNVGGLAARCTLVNQIRSQYQNVLLLDAGDINTGRPESNFFKAEPDIKGYNLIGYDAMALGNHEFDNSLDILKKQMDLAGFSFLSANVKTKDGQYVAQPYIIKQYEGFKVAIFGLTTKEAEIVGNPQIVKDLVFEDEVAVASQLVPELRKKADIIIALVHMGLYNDDSQGSRRLAKEVPGIDLIVDGHTHTKLEVPVLVGTTPIVQAWQWGLYLGEAILTIKNKEVVQFTWKAIPVNLQTSVKKEDGSSELKYLGQPIPEDLPMLTILQPYADQVETELKTVIGTAEDLFPNKEVRFKETALGDLVADSMLWYTQNLKTDFALQNGGGIRTDLPAGPITKKNIYEILPFDNSVVVVTLKGTDVQALFDFIATIPQGKGAFPQVSEGVSFTINYDTGKCENILINGKPIDPDRNYKIATNSFMATGGDGYVAFTNAVEKYDTSFFQRDAFIDYLIYLGGNVKPDVKGRIQIIGQKLAYLLEKILLRAA